MKTSVDNYSEEELQEEGVFDWPVRKLGEEKMDWYYEETELCYIVEGEAVIATEFEQTTVRAGDLVTFPKGLECVWDVESEIEMHYSCE